MHSISVMSGQPRSTHFPGISMHAASIGSAAFLEPCIRILPSSGFFPSILIDSLFLPKWAIDLTTYSYQSQYYMRDPGKNYRQLLLTFSTMPISASRNSVEVPP